MPDINLLVYAYDSSSHFHEAAKRWWLNTMAGTEMIGIPWAVAFGFIRLWTSSRVFKNPMSVNQAASHVESWFARPMVRPLNPGLHHINLAFGFLRTEGRGGNLTAMAVEANTTPTPPTATSRALRA